MPESLRLENQTLDKLSTAPWRFLATLAPLSNAPFALLRPLLDDLVQEECYLEIASSSNQFTEAVFAIKLPRDRATLWQTNLPLILNSLSARGEGQGEVAVSPSAVYPLSTINHQLTLTNFSTWTILSISRAINHQPSTINVASRLTTTGNPFVENTNNSWISGAVDFSWLSRIAGWQINSATNLPRCEFSVIGDGANVRALATIAFPFKAPIELEPWDIPTNLVYDPLIGFMAVRGFRPLLHKFGLWSEEVCGGIPNQAFFWSQVGNPSFRFFALPSMNSASQLSKISEFIISRINPLMAVNPHLGNMPLGSFEFFPQESQLRWKGLPMFTPIIFTADFGSNSYISGGLSPNRVTNRPAPVALMSQFKKESDLLLYDWEITGPNAYGLIQMTQVGRVVFGRSRLSMTNNAILPWIVAVNPKLADSKTSARLSTPSLIVFNRISTVGFTGAEIHALAEWLESPDFPLGTFTLNSEIRSPMPPRPVLTPSP